MFALLTLLLPLTTGTVPPSMHLLDAPIRLMAQLDAPPMPMPEPTSAVPQSELQLRINSLNNQIRLTQLDWPGGSVAMAVVGFITASILLPAIFVWLFAGLLGGSSLVGMAVVLTAIGAVGLVIAIIGIVTGVNAQVEAKAQRDALVLERQQLERQLRAAGTGDYSVERSAPSASSLMCVARF